MLNVPITETFLSICAFVNIFENFWNSFASQSEPLFPWHEWGNRPRTPNFKELRAGSSSRRLSILRDLFFVISLLYCSTSILKSMIIMGIREKDKQSPAKNSYTLCGVLRMFCNGRKEWFKYLCCSRWCSAFEENVITSLCAKSIISKSNAYMFFESSTNNGEYIWKLHWPNLNQRFEQQIFYSRMNARIHFSSGMFT